MSAKWTWALAALGTIVAVAGVAIAWDSPFMPYQDLEWLYALTILALVAAVSAGVWRWKRKPLPTLVCGPVAGAVAGPWVLLALWTVNAAGVDTPAEDVECVLSERYVPSAMQNRVPSEMFECTASWGRLTAERLLRERGAVPRRVGTRDTVRLRPGRLGWAIPER